MEEIIFNSLEELYQRILPALKSKKKILAKNGYTAIDEKDIWMYMQEQKWNNQTGLALCDIVDDILNIDNDKLGKEILDKKARREESEIDLPRLK